MKLSFVTNFKNSLVSTTAGGAAYIFAKREVIADRATRHQKDQKQRRLKAQLESDEASKASVSAPTLHKFKDVNINSNSEASQDPAPADRSPSDRMPEGEMIKKYLASTPFKSKKGDRFS